VAPIKPKTVILDRNQISKVKLPLKFDFTAINTLHIPTAIAVGINNSKKRHSSDRLVGNNSDKTVPNFLIDVIAFILI
jgi:hypothetical protein